MSLDFGGPLLFDQTGLQVEKGERICLLGRNGSGKSTLMKLISGEISPDRGEIRVTKQVRVSRLPQGIPPGLGDTVFAVVANGLGGPVGDRKHEVETAISRLELDPDTAFAPLSGGLKRRVLLARAFVNRPHVLLLDEPTNHLDLVVIGWLEEYLRRFDGGLLFVTHDRVFLRKLATRIVELERGHLSSWACDYATYLRRREAELGAEAEQATRFDRRLDREEAFIRQGVKARRTRNERRVRAVLQMRSERRARRLTQGNVNLQVQEAERSGRLVIEARDVSYGYGEEPVVRDFSCLIMRGDKIGVIGPNGSGKTTLLRLLLNQLEPQQGHVRHGVRLEIAYFDQHRAQLNEEASVQENVVGLGDTLTINGRRRYILSYLQDFLFTPDRARSPISVLSGGERNRLLLARLFARPSNILVLDEPTNDLDLETLELLEEQLLNYSGTILIVSHDRALLDNVVSSTLVFEGEARFGEYVGGYRDWQLQRPADAPDAPQPEAAQKTTRRRPSEGPRKLSFKEKRELEALPERIGDLEEEQEALHSQLADPAFYQESGDQVAQATTRLRELESALEAAYLSWEELEERADMAP